MYSEKNDGSLSSGNIIECNNLGKCYQIYNSPKDRLKQAIWRGRKKYYKDFWALRNVELEIRKGDSLGVIGRNGSGKSTLLQLICGTLSPTEGKVKTAGKIAALLELGSGFNPEFTGIENVYLNASMHGLTREETDSKLSNILGFADIGDFIDQPVKSYSSGMAVRLAFAVIAHVDADILIVDEALAVGDAVFVQRCMRFIRRMREERCLLFVSHDSEAVKNLCNKALWLLNGEPKSIGNCKDVGLEYLRYCRAVSYGEDVNVQPLEEEINPGEVTDRYQKPEYDIISKKDIKEAFDYVSLASWRDNLEYSKGWKTGNAELVEIFLRNRNHRAASDVMRGGEEIEIVIRAKANALIHKPILGFIVRDRLGQDLFGENTLFAPDSTRVSPVEPGGEMEACFRLWMPFLPSGEYTLMASVADGVLHDHIQHHWADEAIIIRVSSSRVRYGLAGAYISSIEFATNNPCKHHE